MVTDLEVRSECVGSKLGTDDGILLGSILGWILRKTGVSLVILLVGVWLGQKLRKSVGSLLGIRLGSSKGYVEGSILGLARRDTNGAPLGSSFG